MFEIRCSGLARIMTCAGTLFFDNLPVQEENEAAREGTAFGEFAQTLIEQNMKPPISRVAKNGFSFDGDMAFFATPLVENIFRRAADQPVCERRVDWVTRSGIFIRGQPDVDYVDHEGALCVDDFKYGWGIVEVTKNWQLVGYAIGAMIQRQREFDVIKLRILQPRPHHEEGHVREWILTREELIRYKEEIEQRMLAIAGGDKTLVTSPRCRYCPAAAEHCPAIGKAFFRGVEYAHHFVQDAISDQELSAQLDLVARVSEVIKIKSDSLNALAVDRIKRGKMVPNYSTESKLGDRKWKPGIDPKAIEVLTGKNVIEQVMLSPAKAEKLGIPKEFINSLVDRYPMGQKLVRKDTTELGNKIFGTTKKEI